ncbi:prepilin-type N-terminal cleavage/methylation domain-containing protein [Oscillatoria sp. FACHB-1407]|uniref:type II secretion system protein n=1 Tax=Oscillatoria sp. FACHB-1407 TaxID=2692847 RepID=UPI001681DC60|nr:prepilin-type N-terminal cleavage/methylation domain-containing protein [Oscillatoria sp. FACHB-1407]MBD2459742.1 prepilin-type N-terminal cleavage/methylation domain-containing protein [Oscillatoria sp. FACHB-1407]
MATRNMAIFTARLQEQLFRSGKQSSQGLTLMEVLVAIVIISLFMSVGMMSIVTTSMFKLRARTVTEVTNWIERDIEGVKRQAAQMSYSLASNVTAGQQNLPLVASHSLTTGEQIAIAGDSTIYVIQSVNGNVVRLTNGLRFNAAQNSLIIPLSKCNATATPSGLAFALQQSLPPLVSSTLTISGRPYTMTRQATVRNAAPFSVLQLAYTVTPQGRTTTTATVYTEVMPDATFQCQRFQ